MRPTYAHLTLLIDAAAQPDRAPSMPLLGPLTGLTLAVALWTALGSLLWALLA